MGIGLKKMRQQKAVCRPPVVRLTGFAL